MLNGVMYRMEKHFPEPERFIPERWLRGEEAARYGCPHAGHKTHPFVFLPFGHGPRQCVGTRFANLEMETLIARVRL
jgi:cytochrome P450 family 49 subfamily A